MKIPTSLSTGLLALCLLGSCVQYHPEPIDLARDTAEWQQLSLQLCPPGTALPLQEMHRIGLMLNPDLNKARLTYARSTAVAEYAGLWQDPSLSVSADRVFRENFNNRSVGLSLALPVTGLPALSKQIAGQYKESDYWTMVAEERSYLCRLDTLRNNIMIIHERHRLMQARLREAEAEMAQIEELHRVGEISFAEYQVACQRLVDLRREEQELDKLHLEKHLELAALLGLHPCCREFELAGSLPGGIPAAVPVPSADVLLSSPALRAMLSAYGATETELRREIRSQYPEINLSPSFGVEEGNTKAGIGFELDIPLWNRNREAIARAGHDRAIKGAEVIALWRSLQHDAVALGDRQQQAIRHCRTEYAGLMQLEQAAQREEELYRAGESSLPQVAEARHELYQRKLTYLDCLGELMDVQTALYYMNPNNN